MLGNKECEEDREERSEPYTGCGTGKSPEEQFLISHRCLALDRLFLTRLYLISGYVQLFQMFQRTLARVSLTNPLHLSSALH